MTAAIYARKATPQPGVSDEAKSVARQIDDARAFAARLGLPLIDDAHMYVDDEVSGADVKAPAGARSSDRGCGGWSDRCRDHGRHVTLLPT